MKYTRLLLTGAAWLASTALALADELRLESQFDPATSVLTLRPRIWTQKSMVLPARLRWGQRHDGSGTHFLENEAFELGGFTFLSCAIWPDFCLLCADR